MVKRTRNVVAVGTLALALTGAGAGIAAAQSTTPTAPSGTTPTTHHHRGERAVVHGELTVHTKTGDKVIDVQRGVVAAVDATTVTVKSTDGFTATYTLDSTTKVHKNKATATVSDVAVNDRVNLRADKAGTTLTAQRIGDTGPAK